MSRDRAQIVIHAASVAQEQDGIKSAPCSVTCAIMCQAGKGYSLWLCKSHEQEHPDVTANCDD